MISRSFVYRDEISGQPIQILLSLCNQTFESKRTNGESCLSGKSWVLMVSRPMLVYRQSTLFEKKIVFPQRRTLQNYYKNIW